MVNAAIRWLLAMGWLTAASAADVPRPSIRSGADTINIEALPPQLREPYEVFRTRCSKCHTLARPLNARLRGDDWRPYIKKMSRRPGSGINEASGAKILEFLKAYGAMVDAETEAKESTGDTSEAPPPEAPPPPSPPNKVKSK